MNLKLGIILCLTFLVFSCKDDKKVSVIEEPKPNRIVLISINAPKKYLHFIKQDSIGKKLIDSTGPRTFYSNNGFSYLDKMNSIQNWIPKPQTRDTITIECYSDFLELSTNNFYTSIKETFLVKNGDTVIFNYEHSIPKATVVNRTVNDEELNYNSYRLKTLFDNKYTSHYLVFGNLFLNDRIDEHEQKSIEYYMEAQNDFHREITLLDSLLQNGQISKLNYDYRKEALNMLMEKHKKNKGVKKWLELNQSLKGDETIDIVHGFDLSQTDSLMTFSFFRDYLIDISQYEIPFIKENNGNSGGYYIDSRIRFDSILKDKRFNQTAKNFLLHDAYHGIGRDFKVADKEKYLEKLQKHSTNTEQIDRLIDTYNLDFNKSEQLILTTLEKDTLTYTQVLKQNKGKWLYIDFWASWCKPCLEAMPASRQLKNELKDKNIEFIYIGLNDKRENWSKVLTSEGLSESQNYFVENGNTSKVIEDLGIKTIPHYLIYNPEGTLVNGYANRPGDGAKTQLIDLVIE
ncbi:TlpA family protein disulfide reductase [Psychroserpens sp. XS_ASV72]|uniref:TlpA family protein disulfide reductase n=1 Tax=Psychroserpens sp. XS_ASV72 TaxID=3241293 RepID=UPI0035187702